MRADFYLIAKPRFLEQPLLLVCELTKRALAAGQHILILARDAEPAEALDGLLWEFDADAWLAPQIAGHDEADDITRILTVVPGPDNTDRPLRDRQSHREGN